MVPTGYHKLPDNIRCRCMRLHQETDGSFWCCLPGGKTDRVMPMQDGPPLPWELAEVVYQAYSHQFGNSQSIDRIAERGGFGWAEVAEIFNRLRREDRATYARLTGKALS